MSCPQGHLAHKIWQHMGPTPVERDFPWLPTFSWLTRLRHCPHCVHSTALSNKKTNMIMESNMFVWVIRILPWKSINFCAHSYGLVLKSWWWDASAMHLTKSFVLFGCEEFRFSKTACTLPAGHWWCCNDEQTYQVDYHRCPVLPKVPCPTQNFRFG